jgi:hypothetical protein
MSSARIANKFKSAIFRISPADGTIAARVAPTGNSAFPIGSYKQGTSGDNAAYRIFAHKERRLGSQYAKKPVGPFQYHSQPLFQCCSPLFRGKLDTSVRRAGRSRTVERN